MDRLKSKSEVVVILRFNDLGREVLRFEMNLTNWHQLVALALSYLGHCFLEQYLKTYVTNMSTIRIFLHRF